MAEKCGGFSIVLPLQFSGTMAVQVDKMSLMQKQDYRVNHRTKRFHLPKANGLRFDCDFSKIYFADFSNTA